MASYYDWAEVRCPYCNSAAELSIDTAGDLPEDMVEDCPVCCHPWQVRVITHGDGRPEVIVTRLSED